MSVSTRHVVSNRYDISPEIRYDRSRPHGPRNRAWRSLSTGCARTGGGTRRSATESRSRRRVILHARHQTDARPAHGAGGRWPPSAGRYAYISDPGECPGRNRRAEIYAELDILVSNASLIAHQTLDRWTPARSIQSSGQRARPACGHATGSRPTAVSAPSLDDSLHQHCCVHEG